MENPKESKYSLPIEEVKKIELLKRRLQFDGISPILIVDVITDGIEEFNFILEEIQKAFPGSEKYDDQSRAYEEYCNFFKLGSSKIKILSNQRFYIDPPHPDTLHSIDQGFKEGTHRKKYDKARQENDTRLIIVRFCNATVQKQLLTALGAIDDFRDEIIKFSKKLAKNLKD